MKISEDTKLDFDDVLIRPKRSTIQSRQDVDVKRTFKFKHSNAELYCFPVIVANMDTTGTIAMSREMGGHNALVALHKHYSVKQLIETYVRNPWSSFITFGLSKEDINKALEFIRELAEVRTGAPIFINLDVANGYTELFASYVKEAREQFSNAVIMAGNVCTPEMTEQLILSGADIVKVGIGPGSVCTTRLTTGVGYPQLSAIIECKDAAHGVGGLVCSDGGCKNAGDVCKAFGAGADFVMLGGMFAGTDECEGEWKYQEGPLMEWNPKDNKWQSIIDKNKKIGLQFYGMSSKEAQEKYNGGLQKYRAAEGKSVIVPYKGPASEVLLDIAGGVRSACAYVGAKRLKDFDKCCSFVRVNNTHNKVFS